jgi:hypothetical protein
MVAVSGVLPEDAAELATVRPHECCDRQDLVIDKKGESALLLWCKSCKFKVEAPKQHPQLRGKNALKRKEALLKAMAKQVDLLIRKFNYRILFDKDMPEEEWE